MEVGEVPGAGPPPRDRGLGGDRATGEGEDGRQPRTCTGGGLNGGGYGVAAVCSRRDGRRGCRPLLDAATRTPHSRPLAYRGRSPTDPCDLRWHKTRTVSSAGHRADQSFCTQRDQMRKWGVKRESSVCRPIILETCDGGRPGCFAVAQAIVNPRAALVRGTCSLSSPSLQITFRGIEISTRRTNALSCSAERGVVLWG